MSDIRKPYIIMLLRYSGKKKSNKIELFDAKLWDEGCVVRGRSKTPRYRLRVNGKWFNSKEGAMVFYSKTNFRDLLMRSLKI